MWLFAKWCPVLLVFTLYFWCIFLAYSLRDFILIPYQNLLDLIWLVRTIICLSNKKESVLLMPCIFIAPDDKMLNSNNLSLNYSQNKKQDQIQKKKRQTNKRKSGSAGTRWPEVTLLSEPPFVYLIAVQKRRFSLNHFKSLKSLQLELVSFCQSGF